jgi:hypothetical protein
MKEISLLSALPHSLSDVLQAKGNLNKDYVNNQLICLKPAPSAWGDVRRALEHEAGQLFTWANAAGIRVKRRATIDDLSAAARSSDITIVLAHWKGPEFRRGDILGAFSDMSPALEDCISKGILEKGSKPYASHVDERDGKDDLVRDLNKAITSWQTWLKFELRKGESAAVSALYAQNKAREAIDAILQRHVVPGARLELDDGLWRPGDIAECFPEDWEGVADFICCTSIYLSEILKKRCRRAMFRADSRLLKPRLAIPAVRYILELINLGQEPLDYMELAYQADSKWGER